jgi:hypothetical protein
MEKVEQLFDGNSEKGIARLEKFSITEDQAFLIALRNTINGTISENCAPGDYIKLYVDGELYMSDTDMERNTNREFCAKANGDVMIAGLGIGLVLHNLRASVNSGKVKSITVIEKYQDVIDLVAPKYADMPIRFVCADVLSYEPNPTERYDTIYFDIWPTISADNFAEMDMLKKRWEKNLNSANPSSFITSWREKDCEILAFINNSLSKTAREELRHMTVF